MVVSYSHGQPDEPLSAEEQAVLAKWLARGAAFEFRSDDGRPLARFLPFGGLLSDDDPPLPDEEVERRLRESPRSTLADFWKRMGAA